MKGSILAGQAGARAPIMYHAQSVAQYKVMSTVPEKSTYHAAMTLRAFSMNGLANFPFKERL